MNPMKRLITLAFAACLAGTAGAQTLDDVLRSIERNNKELQALGQQAEADRLATRTRNNLEDPRVEYSPFFTKGTSGVATSELVVTQGFDFPTLYAARASAARLQREAIDRRHAAARRDLLLTAKRLCLDLIRLNREARLLNERSRNADRLLELFEQRMKEGDAGILEVNKLKMERMNVQAEAARNTAAHRAALQELLALNGNLPLDFEATDYPQAEPVADLDALRDEMMGGDAALQAADATARAAAQEVAVSRQGWLPQLEIGYRRNTDLNERFNGFLVGGSLPLFANRKKTRIARAQAVSSQLLADDARLKAEATVQGRFNELQQLQASLAAYDVPLMRHTLSLLYQAVTEGHLSLIDYCVEADGVYRNLQSQLDVEHQYQLALAEVYKNRL